MGAEQSSKAKRQEPTLSKNDMEKLLNAQRQMYEAKCQTYVQKAAAETARNAQAAQNTQATVQQALTLQQSIPLQQPIQMPQSMPVQQSMLTQQSMPMQHTMPNKCGPMPQAQFTSNASQTNTSIERQRTPYSYNRDTLLNMRESDTCGPSLYPNLSAGPSSQSPMHTFDFQNNNVKPPRGFVMVNRDSQIDRPQPSAPALLRFTNRDRSNSRPRNNNINNGFKCVACREMFGTQIFQCSSGHSLCKSCKESYRPCGQCGSTATNTRNFEMEKLVADIKVPCPHKNDGCQLFLKNAEINFHIKKCPFKELSCPVGCSWKGGLKQLSAHFDSSHPGEHKADVDCELLIHDINRNSRNTFFVVIGAFNFLFHVKIISRTVYMTAQLIGTKMSASKWSYQVHVYNKNERRRKYSYTDVCTSNAESVDDIYKDGKCLTLAPVHASTFINNGGINFKFYIKKEIESKSKGGLTKNNNAAHK